MSIIKGLDASRRLQSDLALQKHHQELEKTKIQRQLQTLSRSRRNFIDNSIVQSKLQYQQMLKSDPKVSSQHLNRQKRTIAQRAKVAQQDFERQRDRLLNQRNEYDDLDKRNRVVDKLILDLKAKSRRAEEDQDRLLIDLNNRKQALLKVLQESRDRQNYHYDQSKRLAEF